ncbi:hypothetical protein O181_086798 [Austropuccinia psidii MF-1]|uniref:Uncharacterized protein n=1 Tax=Austropuccinia psidii MF-1 TaxID=1389203 RepID=A0A9Q3P045_9BASI|nr:hypothetical protein [Austropuccinia psidii MF-1]
MVHRNETNPWQKKLAMVEESNNPKVWQWNLNMAEDHESQTTDTNARRTRACNDNCTLDDIANTLQDVRKRTNIEKYTPYKSSGFKEKQRFNVEFEDKPREGVEEVAKKKNSCHNCGSKHHYANNYPKAKKVYGIEKVPDEQSPTEDSESDSMGDAIREQSDDEQDPSEEFLVEYKEETPLEIQDIKLEAGMQQDTAKKTCENTHKMHQNFWLHQPKEWNTYMEHPQK